ncbi:MAG TPA: hypothetical protein V6C58_22555 [Allocoleopsis sp.]
MPKVAQHIPSFLRGKMKKIKIEFIGQSKGVVANVELEYSDNEKSNLEVLQECKELYEEAYKYADYKTKQLNGLIR